MEKDLRERARRLLRHGQRIRNYMLSGESPGDLWEGFPKDPTISQVRALLALNYLGPCRLKTFASSLQISGPAASEMVDRLVEMNFVEREQDPDDRRRIVLRLTPAAKERVEKHETFTLERIAAIMDRLSPQEVEAWLETSAAIDQAIESLEEQHESRQSGKCHLSTSC